MILANLQQQSPYAIGWGTLALINAGLAQAKNRSGLNWFLLSLLLGPLAPTDGFRVWFEDALGAEVAGPAGAARVVVRIIATSRDLRGSPAARLDTLTLAFGGRNR